MKHIFSFFCLNRLPTQLTISLVLLLIFSGSFSVTLYAQSACEEALRLATKEYDQGLFERATFRLQECLDRNTFTEKQQNDAYLLLGRIYYANLQIEHARESVRKLLSANPDYELDPEEHKPGFIDLYEEVMSEIIETQGSKSGNRSGFWLNVGVGGAYGHIQCECPPVFNDAENWMEGGLAGSYILALGGTLGPKFQLGAELSQLGRFTDINGAFGNTIISTFSVLAKYYPKSNSTFFLKGGIGVGNIVLKRNLGGDRGVPTSTASLISKKTLKLESTGLGMQFGLGIDIPLGKEQKVALTPYANLSLLFVEEDIQFARYQEFVGADELQRYSFQFTSPENPVLIQLGLAFSVL